MSDLAVSDGPDSDTLPMTANTSDATGNVVFHGSRSSSHIGRKPAFGQSCSMKTLLQDGILQAGEKVLTLEHEGHKFYGDLRRDGTILMRGVDDAPHMYATPVAWANHCCKLLNPDSKPLNAWSSIRFRGKRLDSYKLKWYRAQKKPNNVGPSPGNHIAGGIDALNSSIIRNSQQQNLQNQQGSSKLMIHNPITNYFPQYENPLKNKKLIKSLLISNNMDSDCKKLVAKSLDLSMDPCKMSQQIYNDISADMDMTDNNNDDQSSINNININNGVNSKTDINNIEHSQDGSNNGDDIVNGRADNDQIANGSTNHATNYSNNNVCRTLKTTVINYEQLGTRGPHNTHDLNTMVKCIPFSAVDRIQPFNVTVSTNALLLVDFHCHLVAGEVAGYLAGSWDFGNHTLTVTQAFPCRASLSDESSTNSIEEEIRQDIEKRNLTLVGWYHSHQGRYSNHPTIKDIQNQMEYQITMKESINGYIPCIGLICSPHDTRSEDDLSPSFQIYWVMPPPEQFANHFGRPMQMYYSVTRDLFLTQDLLLEMRLLANHYTSKANDMVDFAASYEFNENITNLDKLSGSIKPKLPKDLQESEYPEEPAIWKAAVDHFWKFLKNLVITPSGDQGQEGQPDEKCNLTNQEVQPETNGEAAAEDMSSVNAAKVALNHQAGTSDVEQEDLKPEDGSIPSDALQADVDYVENAGGCVEE